jgi:hypothetical protein
MRTEAHPLDEVNRMFCAMRRHESKQRAALEPAQPEESCR